MITFNAPLRFGGHQPSDQDTKRSSRTVSQNRLPRSTGAFGSNVSMASASSRQSDASVRSNGNAKKRESKPVVGELSQAAYQQALFGAHAYFIATMGLAHFMAVSAMQGNDIQQNLLTQIRSTEIDKQGAAVILNNLEGTTEAFDTLQKNLDQLIKNHHKIVETVRQDPRFDRKA